MKAIDLFAGTGAFSLSLERLGCEVVYANDSSPHSRDIYTHNFPKHRFHCGDVMDVQPNQVPAHDILTMGFPCVSFSNLGKRQGFDDARAQTVFHVLKLVEHHQPLAVVVENVKSLLSHDKGRSFTRLKDEFARIGYHVKHCVVDTAKITHIPHHRERVFLVALRKPEHFAKLDLTFEETDTADFRHYLEPHAPGKYFYDGRFKCWDLLQRTVLRNDRVYQLRYFEGGYVRELEQVPCLTGSCGTGGHMVPLIYDRDKRIRKLTPREVFNFQGFPESYSLCGPSDSRLYQLAGNSITVSVGTKVLDRVMKAIKTPP